MFEQNAFQGIASILLVNGVYTPDGQHLDYEGAVVLAGFWYREYVKLAESDNGLVTSVPFERQIASSVYTTNPAMWRPSANFASAMRQVYCYLQIAYPMRHRVDGPRFK